MEEALAKIRPHTSSSLPHQKTPATLLHALEATLQEQKTEKSPTAYFAALLTTLDGTLQMKDIGLGDGDVLPAELYLLALVTPFVPPPVIRANLNTLLSLSAPLFPLLQPHAPPLRSQLALYSCILKSLDRSQLEVQGVRQTFASILQLCLDPRPKVRKKAADIVKDTLASPPPPMARHPYADRVAEWVKTCLAEVNSGLFSQSKSSGKTLESPTAETAIHILAFLRPVLLNLPPSSLPSVTNLLLTLPRLGNPYLSQSAYSILSDLFSTPAEDESSNIINEIPAVLKAVLSSPPSKTDPTLSPAWVNVLGNAMVAYSIADPDKCATELGKVWKTVWSFLESNNAATRKAAAESLGLLSRCFTPALIKSAIIEAEVDQEEPKSVLGGIISQTTIALDSLAFARSIPELLSVISSLITNLRYDNGNRRSTPAAKPLLLPLIQKIGDLRTQKGFEHKEAADATLAIAIRVLGPEVILQILPLNLEPADRQAGHEPRAYLLPLLSQPHPSLLSHFVTYFVPLSERMFSLQQKAETEGRASEAKVWSVLIAQIWAGLTGYCHSPADLKEAFTPAFSQLLSQLLYGQPELRPSVLKALKIMVDSNVSPSLTNAIAPEDAAQNVAFLRTQAESWLAVFFNVFGSVGRDGRGMVGDVISAWAAIAGEQEITKAHCKVVDLFKQNLAKSQVAPVPNHGTDDSGSMTAMTQDILILLLPYLSSEDATALFQTCLSSEVLGNKDNGVQKRGYKILTKLVDNNKVVVDTEDILGRLDELAEGLSPAAKKDRFTLLTLLVSALPSSAMHVIPSLIPEAVLGTKEPSEKARSAAFDLIVTMGRKMDEGGVVKRSLVDGMDEDGPTEATASIEEYMTMVAGGLAGATPHMISATVTAISRLVFEFKDSISAQMQSEIFTTLLVFLTSANREIVKSTLGYIKLSIHTLPTDLLQPHLKDLVPALLRWSHDHKNHFKAKVRHIFERMLRRFGWTDVYSCAGEEEAAKVLVNIKKRKERAKRKKNARGEEEDEDECPSKPATGDAFEDVLYGSESELDDSDDEVPTTGRSNAPSKRKGVDHGARLRIDDDEPMDLLQGAASRITSAQSNRRRKPGQDAARFKTEEDTGKMIIDSDSDSDANTKDVGVDVAGSAYRESITSVDGFTRGPNGRVKFNKDTKKRRREHEAEDVEMADGEAVTGKGRKSKRKSDVKLGHEFKAKKAGGDIKKGGVDPYAYLPLAEAAKKVGHGGRSKIGIAGKR